MNARLEIFAEKVATGSSPIDPSTVFAETLSDISGRSPVIYDDDIKSSYLEKLSGEIGAKMPEMGDLPLNDFYNYAVFANRPVKMGGSGMAYAGIPGQFGEMAEKAGIPPEQRGDAVRTLAKVAKTGESVSENGVTAERISPIGPTPKNGSLKKMFMTAALMASMTINALAGPYGQAFSERPTDAPQTSWELVTDAGAKAKEPRLGKGDAKKLLLQPMEPSGTITITRPDGKSYMTIAEHPNDPQNKMLKGMLDAEGFKPIPPMVNTGWPRRMETLKKAINDPFFSKNNPEWVRIQKAVSDMPLIEQLYAVNRYWNNKITYMSDEVTYGKPEYWATPSESLNVKVTGRLRDKVAKSEYAFEIDKNAKKIAMGDCEDFAIAKFATLWNLGLGNDVNMKLMGVQDQEIDSGHAILAFQDEGRTYFLDIGDSRLQTQESLDGCYLPMLAMNTKRCWYTDGAAEGSPTATFKERNAIQQKNDAEGAKKDNVQAPRRNQRMAM